MIGWSCKVVIDLTKVLLSNTDVLKFEDVFKSAHVLKFKDLLGFEDWCKFEDILKCRSLLGLCIGQPAAVTNVYVLLLQHNCYL